MDTQTTLLKASNALHLCESLLLEAYISAGESTGNAILLLMHSLTTDREAMSQLVHLAALEEALRKEPGITKDLTAQSGRVC